MVEYCSLGHPKASPPDQRVERPKKGTVEDHLSSFHGDTLPWTPAVRPRMGLLPEYKDKKCNNQPYNTGTQEMAMTENIGIETRNVNNCGTADGRHHLNTDNDR